MWVLLSEMYPTKVRGIAMSIAGFALWVGTYLVSQAYSVVIGYDNSGRDILVVCSHVCALYADYVALYTRNGGEISRRDRKVLVVEEIVKI